MSCSPTTTRRAVSELRLGIAVGLTTTDAVVLDARARVRASGKGPIADASRGITAAIRRAVRSPEIEPSRIRAVMLGSADAARMLDRQALKRVAVVRIGSPLTHAVPPLATWPVDLRLAVTAGEIVVRGGADYDGQVAAELDEEAIVRFLAAVAGTADAVAITGVFSIVAAEQELATARLVQRELGGGIPVSLSHEIGTLGLLERENATVLNAALVGAAEEVAVALDAALMAEQIDAEPYFVANDGTLMALGHALRFPVRTIGSGPASAMRGAAHLSGEGEAVVVVVGESATDVGLLVNGFPLERTTPAEIAGVRASFRMPAFETLAIGERSPAALSDEEIAEAIDRVTAGRPSPPLVVVGGGATGFVADRLAAMCAVIRPRDGDVAGAIGAAIADVSGDAERICQNRPDRRREALEQARAAAFASAIGAGADPDAVDVVDVETVPLTYLGDPAIRIRVKVAGPRAGAQPVRPRASP
jgi:N-methylhydantoinase A/oxoprolinase/acetone carboxylase beta subunit